MREEYDFSNAIKNPYVKPAKQQITINLSTTVITYFKNEAAETGIPYQTLINLYLTDCVDHKKKLKTTWS